MTAEKSYCRKDLGKSSKCTAQNKHVTQKLIMQHHTLKVRETINIERTYAQILVEGLKSKKLQQLLSVNLVSVGFELINCSFPKQQQHKNLKQLT